MSAEVRVLSRGEAEIRMLDIAALRINVFQEFPYIYDGSIDYEVKYLVRYFKAPRARFIGAFSKFGSLIGVATCLPLSEEEDFIKKPFLDAGFNVDEICYFGESVLLSEYRGQGIGHKFFDEREAVAQNLGLKLASFCAVSRPADHPLRPSGYQPLDKFWLSRGYQKQENLKSIFEWKDIDQEAVTAKEMQYWIRELK